MHTWIPTLEDPRGPALPPPYPEPFAPEIGEVPLPPCPEPIRIPPQHDIPERGLWPTIPQA